MASNEGPPPSDASNKADFEDLLAKHRRLVFKVAATYARDPEDRRDLVQEILIQTWRAYPGYDAGRSFSTWMYRIALNVAISHRRSVVYQTVTCRKSRTMTCQPFRTPPFANRTIACAISTA